MFLYEEASGPSALIHAGGLTPPRPPGPAACHVKTKGGALRFATGKRMVARKQDAPDPC